MSSGYTNMGGNEAGGTSRSTGGVMKLGNIDAADTAISPGDKSPEVDYAFNTTASPDDGGFPRERPAQMGQVASFCKLLWDYLFAEEADPSECDPYVKITLRSSGPKNSSPPYNTAKQTYPIWGGGRNVKFTSEDKNILQWENIDTPLDKLSLKVSVYDEDLGKDDKIGSGVYELSDLGGAAEGTWDRSLNIASGNKMFSGQVMMTISFKNGQLRVTVKECRGLKTQRFQLDKEASIWEFAKNWIVIAAWLLFYGTIFFFLEPDKITTWGNSLWFALVTTSTVGYGDFYPETATGRYINSFMIVIGTLLLGVRLSAAFGFYIARKEKARRLLQLPRVISYKVLYYMFGVFFVMFVIGAIFLVFYESEHGNEDFKNWDVSVQFLFVTSTTVGYGDIAPVSPLGKILGSVLILAGTGLLGLITSTMIEVYEMKKQIKLRKVVMSQSLTTVDEFQYFDQDGEADGEINKYEFLKKMLVYINACDEKLVNIIMDRFRELDIDNSGVLTKEDFMSRSCAIEE